MVNHPASPYALLSKIFIRFGGLPNFLTKVSYSALHCPLHVANQGTLVHCLSYEMEGLMDTWVNEVEPVLPQLVINEFEFAAPGTEEDIGLLEACLLMLC